MVYALWAGRCNSVSLVRRLAVGYFAIRSFIHTCITPPIGRIIISTLPFSSCIILIMFLNLTRAVDLPTYKVALASTKATSVKVFC